MQKKEYSVPFKDPIAKKKYHKEYHKKWYAKNKENRCKQINNREELIRKMFQEYKSKLSCSNCEENESVALDFHHVGEKTDILSVMVHDGFSWEKIQEEIKKCIVLCSNCHRIEHYKNKY
jgi:hypothetical protein